MSRATATAPFTITGWEETTVVEDGGLRLYRTHVSKRFGGDLQGESVADMTMVTIGGRPVAYGGFEHVSGSLGGRAGSFVLHHNAANGLEGGLSLTVVPSSGTGELAGLRGSARIEIAGQVGDTSAAHALVLDYTLD